MRNRYVRPTRVASRICAAENGGGAISADRETGGAGPSTSMTERRSEQATNRPATATTIPTVNRMPSLISLPSPQSARSPRGRHRSAPIKRAFGLVSVDEWQRDDIGTVGKLACRRRFHASAGTRKASPGAWCSTLETSVLLDDRQREIVEGHDRSVGGFDADGCDWRPSAVDGEGCSRVIERRRGDGFDGISDLCAIGVQR